MALNVKFSTAGSTERTNASVSFVLPFWLTR